MSDPNVERDKEGKIRTLEHFQQPHNMSDALMSKNNVSPKEIATEYLKEVSPLLEIDDNMLKGSENKLVEDKLTLDESSDNKLEFKSEKPAMGTTVVTFAQTYKGAPIIDGGFSVYVNDNQMQVTRSQNSIHYDMNIKEPSANAKYMPNDITEDKLSQILGINESTIGKEKPQIHTKKLSIYQYEPELRLDYKIKENEEFRKSVYNSMTIPDVSQEIQPNAHYFVSEIIFSFTLANWTEPVNWRAYIEVETGSILHLLALLDFVDGFVYTTDPLRLTGDINIRPSSGAAVLDNLRTLVTLEGLRPPNPQNNKIELKGDLVELADVSNPFISPPSEPSSGSFQYEVLTDNFAAVNAYYHSHNVFKMAKDMGFPFNKTRFPVRVDHRAVIGDGCINGNCVNAMAPWTPNGGSDGFRFALAEMNTKFGIANCYDIVLHEFGHSLLEESVDHPNLGFAHNCGDALAAIICDPDSNSADKGKTFYCINRRHDRKVSQGWGWGGINDTGFPTNGGYRSEEVLSTTMVRIYNSIGGGSNSKEVKRKASRYMTYLIFKTISNLDPNTRARNAREFLSILTSSDISTDQFENFHGGHIGKVIRWGFEKQGLFQLPGSPSPVTREGGPPEMDVYIDDGRNGEYNYQDQLGQTQDICNRNQSDDIFEHQNPIANRENFVYVKVKNRGHSNARGISVKVYHSNKIADSIFSDDFELMEPFKINVNQELPSGNEVVVGPFKWTPITEDKNILAVTSCDKDKSNADTLQGSFPYEYLISFDNNNAQRKIQVVQVD